MQQPFRSIAHAYLRLATVTRESRQAAKGLLDHSSKLGAKTQGDILFKQKSHSRKEGGRKGKSPKCTFFKSHTAHIHTGHMHPAPLRHEESNQSIPYFSLLLRFFAFKEEDAGLSCSFCLV